MLKLKKVASCPLISIEFDSYIAIKVIFGENPNWIERTAYWRTGNFIDELIEIGVGNELGVIRKITIVGIKEIYQNNFNSHTTPLRKGIPVFERINYNKNLIFDEKGPLEMFVGNDKVQVFFSHNKISSGLVCDRVTCLFDKDNNFCGFEVAKITEKEMGILKENFIDRLNQN